MKMPDHEPVGSQARRIGLPPRYFLYTMEQVGDIIQVPNKNLKKYIWFESRDVGAIDKEKILARNIAPPGDRPMWRVSEPELIRWLRHKGFKIYHRGWLRD